jgi:hypothetical protein
LFFLILVPNISARLSRTEDASKTVAESTEKETGAASLLLISKSLRMAGVNMTGADFIGPEMENFGEAELVCGPPPVQRRSFQTWERDIGESLRVTEASFKATLNVLGLRGVPAASEPDNPPYENELLKDEERLSRPPVSSLSISRLSW